MKKIKRKFFSEENHYQDSTDLDKFGDRRHETKSSYQQQKPVHDDGDQPRYRNRHVFSADARLKTCEDFDEKSHNRSMISLPVTSSPVLNRRMQTPRHSYTFTVEREAQMFGDEILEDTSHNRYRKCEEASSRRLGFQTENEGDKYFGAKVQEQSPFMSEEDVSNPRGFMGRQDKYSEQEKDMAHDDRLTLQHLEQ
jgi:hypothetical protein